MQAVIQKQLQEIEHTKQVKILWAVESGSRAWGFPSPDSDYDARFIYINPRLWYLSLDEKRDVIEHACDSLLDINGWDLRKALRLYKRSNPVMFEWLQSPIVYAQNQQFIKELLSSKNDFFSPIAAVNHYLTMGRRAFEEFNSENPSIKKFFYALRAALCARWIAESCTCPPMELKHLLSILKQAPEVELIRQLVEQKSRLNEKDQCPIQPSLQTLVRAALEFAESKREMLPPAKGESRWLDEFFVRWLEQAWT